MSSFMPWNERDRPPIGMSDGASMDSGEEPFVSAVPTSDYDHAFTPPQAHRSPPLPFNFNLSPQQTPEQAQVGIIGEKSVSSCTERILVKLIHSI